MSMLLCCCLGFKPTKVITPPGLYRLPDELIGEICLHFAAFDSRGPLVLCWISRRWRTVAGCLTKLWIRPTFDLTRAFFPAVHPDDMLGREARLAAHMLRWVERAQRSDAVCLSILRGCQTYRWNESLDLHALVAQFAHCFFSLELDATQEQLASLFETHPHFSRLQSLSLRLPILTRGLGFDLTSAPRLHTVKLAMAATSFGGPLSFSIDVPTLFPWSQLTTVEIDGVLREHVWHDLLAQCSVLRMGRFRVTPDFAATPSALLPVITLSDLVGLHITVQHRFDLHPDLTLLVVPALQNISFLADAPPSGPSYLLDLLRLIEQRSGVLNSAVNSIELTVKDGDGGLLTSLLRPLPNLEKVSLRLRCQELDALLPVLLPALRELIQEGGLQRLETLDIVVKAVEDGEKTPSLFENLLFRLSEAVEAWAAAEANVESPRVLTVTADAEVVSALGIYLGAETGLERFFKLLTC